MSARPALLLKPFVAVLSCLREYFTNQDSPDRGVSGAKSARSGQAAMEFLVIFILLAAALSVVAVMSYGKVSEINQARLASDAAELMDVVEGRLFAAYAAGDGFSTELDLPQSLSGKDYYIGIEGSLLQIGMDGQNFTRMLAAGNISGTLSKGSNTVSNSGGAVVLS